MLGARDIFRGGRWHKSSTPGAIFSMIDSGVSALTQTTVTITGIFNKVCSAKIEYGLTTSYGSETTEETSFNYSVHTQRITGLAAGTTYYYRWVGTDQQGTVVTSEDFFGYLTFTTEGDVVAPGVYGKRPDPAFPDSSATEVYVAPATIPHQDGLVSTLGTDSYTALQAWVNSLPQGAIAVFDNSEGGAGVTYTLSHRLELRGKQDITFWGYNTRLNMSQAGGFYYHGIDIGGGTERCSILGFGIYGLNVYAATAQAFGMNSGFNHGISLREHCRDITIMDCTIERFYGDCIFASEFGPGFEAPAGYYMGGFEVAYNDLGLNGRMVVTTNQGQPTSPHPGGTKDYGWKIHNNDMYDAGLNMWGIEDSTPESATEELSELYFQDNRMNRWNWWNPPGGGLVSIVCYGSDWASDSIGAYRGLYLDRNLFMGGNMGAFSGGGGLNQNVLFAFFNFGAAATTVPKYDVYIRDNVCDLPAAQQGSFGYGVLVYNADGLTITDNDFQGRPISYSASANVTESGNT